MVRVAALKNAVEEGDTAPDLAGLAPAPAAHRGLGARPRDGRAPRRRPWWTRSCPPWPSTGSASSASTSSRTQQRAFLARYFTAEVLPALTPLAIDVSRPFPKLANLSLNLALLLAPAEGEEQPRLARGAGAGRPAPAGAPAGRRREHLRAAGGDHPRRAGHAVPGPDGRWSRPPSASPATRRWSSTTRAGATTWRPSRRSCASAAGARWCAWRWRPGWATRCSAILVERLEIEVAGRLPRARPARHPRPAAAGGAARARAPARAAAEAAARAGRRASWRTSSRACARATCCCTTPTSPSSPWWPS